MLPVEWRGLMNIHGNMNGLIIFPTTFCSNAYNLKGQKLESHKYKMSTNLPGCPLKKSPQHLTESWLTI